VESTQEMEGPVIRGRLLPAIGMERGRIVEFNDGIERMLPA